MSSSSTTYNPLKIAAIATGVVATATVSYAIYFDYKRRHDPVFRAKLLRDQQKVSKTSQKQAETGKAVVEAALRRALVIINAQSTPDSPAEKEQYFMEQVSQGEVLSARTPEFYVAAAIAFYKALKVYPAPQELIMIYQKTQPPAVFDLVMELISLEMSSLNASASSRDPRDGSSEPLLEEIDDESPSQSTPAQSSSKASSASGASTASPTSSGSFIVVDEEDKASAPASVVVGEESEEAVKVEEEAKVVAGQDPPEEPIN